MKSENWKHAQITGLLCIVLMFIHSAVYSQFPEPKGYVNDFAGVIPIEYENKMTAIAEEVEQKTGVEIAVVTVRNMGGLTETEYTTRLFKSWGIGSKENDEGVLIFMSLDESRLRIETGYGIESVITDGTAGQILDESVIPLLQRGEYGPGFYQGVLAVADLIAKDKGVVITGSRDREQSVPRSRNRADRGGCIPIVIILLLIILTRGRIIPWLLLMSMGGGGRGGGFSGGGFGGGFGGFGGGMSGGGGASRGF
jgi:uncharacterized protein